jgi:Cu/Zn superoxide dismutase
LTLKLTPEQVAGFGSREVQKTPSQRDMQVVDLASHARGLVRVRKTHVFDCKSRGGPKARSKVQASGDGKASLLDPNVTLGDGPNSLFHEGGTSIVIHEKTDDYKTDPAGNSGARIACGVIVQ